MKQIWIMGTALGFAISLSACQTAPTQPDQTLANCETVMMDEEPAGNMAEVNVTLAEYCPCLIKDLQSYPDEDTARLAAALDDFAGKLRSGNDPDEVFKATRKSARAPDASPVDKAQFKDLDDMTEQLEGTLESMADTGGSCHLPS